jgi:hypothetical protein
MFVRKSSYDTVVSERDRLAVEVARLKAELRISNGEITSLKFRLNDVSFRYDQIIKVGEKKAAPVVEDSGVYFEVVPVTRQPMPGCPKGQTGSTGASTVSKPNSRSISRTVRENDVTVDDIQQINYGLAGFAAAVATAVEETSYSYSSASVCRADSDDRYSSSGSSSCSNNDTPTNTDSSYPD